MKKNLLITIIFIGFLFTTGCKNKEQDENTERVLAATKNSFADEVMNYGKAGETKYLVEDINEEESSDNIITGICYTLNDLHGEYIPSYDKSYKGVVIIKRDSENPKFYNRFVYLASNKLYFNTTKDYNLDSQHKLGKITGESIKEGSASNLTFKNCCEFYKSINSNYNC